MGPEMLLVCRKTTEIRLEKLNFYKTKWFFWFWVTFDPLPQKLGIWVTRVTLLEKYCLPDPTKSGGQYPHPSPARYHPKRPLASSSVFHKFEQQTPIRIPISLKLIAFFKYSYKHRYHFRMKFFSKSNIHFTISLRSITRTTTLRIKSSSYETSNDLEAELKENKKQHFWNFESQNEFMNVALLPL